MADSQSGNFVEPSTTMKVDETSERKLEHENKEDEENKNRSVSIGIDEARICSPNVMATSKMKCPDENSTKSNEFNRSFIRSTSVLRPSQLNGSVGNTLNTQKSTFLLNPSRLNPFAKLPNDETSVTGEGNEKQNLNWGSTDSTPKFLPLLQNGNKSEPNVKSTTSIPSTSMSHSSDFVFGQNIQDRVVSTKSEEVKTKSCTNANGTSDMLFSSALKENSIADANTSGLSQATKSLSESAREYEESRAVKRKYEEVEVFTGEEEEINVIQVTCKLFAFDKTGGNWQERGRGLLRLNDQEMKNGTHSRLVFRSAGSLRVVLNTKIWAEMTVQQASNKSIRLTAFDRSGEIKVFLLTGNPDDIKQLYKHLEIRLKTEMERQKSSNVDNVESPLKKCTETSESN